MFNTRCCTGPHQLRGRYNACKQACSRGREWGCQAQAASSLLCRPHPQLLLPPSHLPCLLRPHQQRHNWLGPYNSSNPRTYELCTTLSPAMDWPIWAAMPFTSPPACKSLALWMTQTMQGECAWWDMMHWRHLKVLKTHRRHLWWRLQAQRPSSPAHSLRPQMLSSRCLTLLCRNPLTLAASIPMATNPLQHQRTIWSPFPLIEHQWAQLSVPSHATYHITRPLAFLSQLPLGLPTQSLSSRFLSISLIHPTPHSHTAALPRTDTSNWGMHPLLMAAHCLNYRSGRRLPSHSPLSITMLQQHTTMQRHHGLVVLSHSFPGIPSPLPLSFQIH